MAHTPSGHDPPWDDDGSDSSGSLYARFPIPASAVVGAIRCSLTHPNAVNLVLNRGTHFEVYACEFGDGPFEPSTAIPGEEGAGFQLTLLGEKQIAGAVAHTVEVIRPPGSAVDLLWVMTSAFRCAVFAWAGDTGAVVQLWTADISSIFHSLAGTRQRTRAHPSGRYVGLSFFQGEFHLGELVYDAYRYDEETASHVGRVGILVHAFKVGDDATVIDYALLAEDAGLLSTTLTLAALFEATDGRRRLRIYTLDFDLHQFVEVASPECPEGLACLQPIALAEGDGLVAVGPEHVVLYAGDHAAVSASVAVPSSAGFVPSELDAGSIGAGPVATLALGRGQVLVAYADGRVCVVSCCLVRPATRGGLLRRRRAAEYDLVASHILTPTETASACGPLCGVVALTPVEVPAGGVWVDVGEGPDNARGSVRACLVLASAVGESAVIGVEILGEKDAPARVTVLHRFPSLGPIACMAALPLAQSSTCADDGASAAAGVLSLGGCAGGGLVLGSGVGRCGAISIARPGIGFTEAASVSMPGVTGLWSVDVDGVPHLLLSFVNETRAMACGPGDVLEEVLLPWLRRDSATLHASAACGGVLFVTPSAVCLWTGGVVAEWRPDKERSIVLAAGFEGHTVVALSGDKSLCYVECLVDNDTPVITVRASVSLAADVSCLSLFCDGPVPLPRRDVPPTPVPLREEAMQARGGFDLGGIVTRARRHLRNVSLSSLGSFGAGSRRQRGEAADVISMVSHKVIDADVPRDEQPRSLYVAVGMWRTSDVVVLSLPALEAFAHAQLPHGVVSRSILLHRLGAGGPCVLLVGLADGHLVCFEGGRGRFSGRLSPRRTLLVGTSPITLSPFVIGGTTDEPEWAVLAGCDRSAVVRCVGGVVKIHPAGLGMPARLCCALPVSGPTDAFVIASGGELHVGELDTDAYGYRLTVRTDRIGCTPIALVPFTVREPCEVDVASVSSAPAADATSDGAIAEGGDGVGAGDLVLRDIRRDCVLVVCGMGYGDFARSICVFDVLRRTIVGRKRLPGRLEGVAAAWIGTHAECESRRVVFAHDKAPTAATSLASLHGEQGSPASVRSAGSAVVVTLAEVPSPSGSRATQPAHDHTRAPALASASIDAVSSSGSAAPESVAVHIESEGDDARGPRSERSDLGAAVSSAAVASERPALESALADDAYFAVAANAEHEDDTGVLLVYSVRRLPLMGRFDTGGADSAGDQWPFRVSLVCSVEVEGPAACVAVHAGLVAVGSGCTLSMYALAIEEAAGTDTRRGRMFASLRLVARRTFDAFVVGLELCGDNALLVCDMLEGTHVVALPSLDTPVRGEAPLELSLVGTTEPPQSGYIRACAADTRAGPLSQSSSTATADCFDVFRVHGPPSTHVTPTGARLCATVSWGYVPSSCTVLLGAWPFEAPPHNTAGDKGTAARASPGFIVGCPNGAVGVLRRIPRRIHTMLLGLEASLSAHAKLPVWTVATSAALLQAATEGAHGSNALAPLGSGTSISRPTVLNLANGATSNNTDALVLSPRLEAGASGGPATLPVVDGDLVAAYLALRPDEQEAVAESLCVSPEELAAELEAVEYALL